MLQPNAIFPVFHKDWQQTQYYDNGSACNYPCWSAQKEAESKWGQLMQTL